MFGALDNSRLPTKEKVMKKKTDNKAVVAPHGLTFPRLLSPESGSYSQITWTSRTAEITDDKGNKKTGKQLCHSLHFANATKPQVKVVIRLVKGRPAIR